ncbi:MAG TPA: flagellar biosynthetic protein FliR [Pseudobdellovibrionaceae bacterium]|nr:flagellar biosynthetic protein FliR [Pseudobdellovibrionaceae bacterium]
MNFSTLTEVQVIAFALILLRMTGFLFAAAFFNSQTITMPVKILLSFVLSFLVFSFVKPEFDVARVANTNLLIESSFQEILLGICIGFVTRMFFFIVTMVGSLISVIIGLSSSQLFNPMIGDHGNSFEQYYSILATLVFLSFNGHHYLLMGIEQSYSLIPIGNISIQVGTLAEVVYKFQEMFEITIKMSAPVLMAGLVANVALAILGRAVPQINILVTSFPVLVLTGLFVILLTLPHFVENLEKVLDTSLQNYMQFIRSV